MHLRNVANMTIKQKLRQDIKSEARLQDAFSGVRETESDLELNKTKRLIALGCKAFWGRRGYYGLS